MIITSKEKFINWLKIEHYKDWTMNGYKSTIFQYVYAIESVMKNEGIESFSELTEHIQRLIREYSYFGPKKDFGEKSHNTVINGLKRFMDFLINNYGFIPSRKIYFV